MIIEGVTERTVAIGDVELHLLEAGERDAPLVVLCHGFPELAWSWRHQLPALAAAGYRVVAPDQRGYGRSSRPEAVADYDIVHLTGDIVALIDEAGADQAVVVGHDWGSMVAWQTAHRHADRVTGVVGMSVPYLHRGQRPPLVMMRDLFGDTFFYILYFQEDEAPANLGRDPHRTMLGMLAGLSPEGVSAPTDVAMFDPRDRGGFVERLPQPDTLPTWLSEAELDHYVSEFRRTGFTGGINWYRNFDRNWELTADRKDEKLTVPALFVAGAVDPVLMMTPPSVMDGWVSDLRGTVLIDGAGHWVQQEKPAEVNAALVDFLEGLDLR